jgi:hypothetical protein
VTNTVDGSVIVNSDAKNSTNSFGVSGNNFTVTNKLTIGGNLDSVTLTPANSLVVGGTTITANDNTGSVMIGTGGTTIVYMGGLTVANGGSATLAGRNHTIGGVSLTASSFNVSGDQTILGSLKVAGGSSKSVAIGGNSFTVAGTTTISGENANFSSANETVLHDKATFANDNVTFAGGQVNLTSAAMTGMGAVIFNSLVTANGDVSIGSVSGFVGNGATLDVFGKLTIKGACQVSLAGAATNVVGDLSITTSVNLASNVLINHLHEAGKTGVTFDHGGDSMSVDASEFLGDVSVNMFGGGEVLAVAQNNTGTPTTFAGDVSVFLGLDANGVGNNTLSVGLPNDTGNLAVFAGKVSLGAHGTGNALHALPTALGGSRNNVFVALESMTTQQDLAFVAALQKSFATID